MKTYITVLGLALMMSGCASEPTLIAKSNGNQAFSMDCSSVIEKCYQKAAELCPSGYDIIEHLQKASTLVPHYGEYPMVINVENLTIECKSSN